MTTLVASDTELMISTWLNRHKIEYDFRTSMAGGFPELAGASFALQEQNIALKVQEEYRGVKEDALDIIQREVVRTNGWTLIDLFETDIKERLDATMRKAIQGETVL